jgi:Uma2 family endonuclease
MNLELESTISGPDDLEKMADGEVYEFVNGVAVEKAMGAESDGIAATLIGLLQPFCKTHSLGHVFVPSTGYRCFPNNSELLRKPDVSFVARGRFPDNRPPRGYITIAPDLAVEVISPNDLYEEVQLKMMDYKSVKVRLVWVVSPDTKSVLIRRLDGTCAEVFEDDELSGEDVIPGFSCKVAELFI